MQVNGTNSVNFQGLNFKKKGGAPKATCAELMDNIEKAKEKAEKNIHLLTVVGTTATGALMIAKGKCYARLATKAIATAGEAVSKGALKAGSNIINAVKKGNKIDPQKAMGKITECADYLRNENPVPNKKFVNGVKRFVGNIFDKDKGEAAAKFLMKNNLTNPVGIAQGLIGGYLGIQIADKAGDRLEAALDKKDISSAEKKAEKGLEIFDTIMAVTEGLSGTCN